MDKVLIISREENLELWKAIRNLAWFSDKKVFDGVENNTFDVVEHKENMIKFKEEVQR